MEKYNPKDIEAKWQKYWDDNQTFKVVEDSTKQKFYALVEFPYPSGAGLHVGHPRSYSAMDVIGRKRRAEGQNVLYPMGFDAFGLPTENYAIKTGRPPIDVTEENIATFTRQLKALGFAFDWSRVVDTTDPAYYKWTQWIFLQLHKHGLAYKKNQPINWCPKDKIGLANEEVVGGTCERCGTPVEQRDKEQWMLAITKYADSLLEGLKTVDYIPQARTQQENWIGRSEGAEIHFPIRSITGQDDNKHSVTVFTTRPDTIYGVTFLAISAELAKSWLSVGWQASEEVQAYIENTLKEQVGGVEDGEKEKTGVNAGIVAVNPVNGEEIPVWITNYVMGGVGTGAIMGVPAHDERDFDFAKKFGLEIKQVVAPYIVHVGEYAPRAEKETSQRQVVTAIIRHNQTGEYLLQDMSDSRRGFTGGGIEKGETIEEAVRREVAEETGYSIFESIEKLFVICGHGYKPKKDLNCCDPDTVFLVDVNGEPTQEKSIEDQTAHTLVWKKENDVGSFINLQHHKFAWDWYRSKSPCFIEEGLAINSDFLNGLNTKEATEKIIAYLEEKQIGKRKVNFKLRDWVFSRQRYWGEPIPLVNCENCKGWVPLPEDQLPLTLPPVEKYEPTDNGESPLAAMTEWVNTTCPECGGPAKRETDTMPNWAGSSWYFLRYLDPKNTQNLFSSTPFARRSAITPTEKDVAYFDAFKQIYYPLEEQNIKIWMVNRFLLNGINSDLWMPLRTVAFMAYEKDVASIAQHLETLGYTATAKEKWGHEFMNGDVRVEIVPIFQDDAGLYSWTPKAARQDLKSSDLPAIGFGRLFNCAFRTVAPEYNLAHYEYINKHEPREGHGDNDKIEFLREWVAGMNEKFRYWAPVDWYNGGMEHTVLHLLYSRFWNQFLYNIGVVPNKEPYKKRTSHGMILAQDGRKMSKSLGNVVNPDEMVDQFGADALRTYIMFMGPFDQAVAWDTNGLIGVKRFLERVWNLFDKVTEATDAEKIISLLHQTIQKVSEDIEAMHFNTAVAQMMQFSNELAKQNSISKETYTALVQLLAPFAPHISEELWTRLGGQGSVAYAPWPKFNPELAKETSIKIVVQVNGKVRDSFDASPDISEEDAKEKALTLENVIKHLEGKEPKKVIYVKGKLVSVVI